MENLTDYDAFIRHLFQTALFTLLFITSNSYATRVDYNLHVPDDLPVNPKLVVVLHGCTQGAKLIERTSRWNEVADREKFIVVYPDQSLARNRLNCWNWFRAKNQRGEGEAAAIVELVEKVRREYNVDPDQMFAVGFSAGSGMSAILAACWPSYFKGVGLHSGPAFKSAKSALAAIGVLTTGPKVKERDFEGTCSPKKYLGSVIIIHGETDGIVNFRHARQSELDFFKGLTIRDEHIPAGQNSRAYHVKTTQEGDQVFSFVRLKGTGHLWSGGTDEGYSSSKGPNAAEKMWEHFTNRP